MKPRGHVNSVVANSCHRITTAPSIESQAPRFDSPFSLFSPVQFRCLSLSLIALAAVLVGCKVGPDYKRPEATTIPAAYTGATNLVATDADTTNSWKIAEPQAQI